MKRNHIFGQSMESPKSALERLQGALWLSNTMIKRRVMIDQKKSAKKSCEYQPGARETPRGALYKNH